MHWRTWVVTGIGALVALTVFAGQDAVAARSPEVPSTTTLGFPATVQTTVPAGGRAWVGSPTLPRAARQVTVTVAAGAGGKGAAFASMYTGLAGLSNNERLLYCSVLGVVSLGIGDHPLLVLAAVARRDTMQMCFQIVAHLTAPRAAVLGKGHDRSSACASTVFAVPVTTGAGGEAATVAATGGIAVARRPALRVVCRIVGDKMILKIRASSRKSTLRKVVGERLTIGFASAPGSASDIPLRLTFGTPR